jgi:glycosyltransferase involved in cell wall biosynthesis
MRPGLIPDAHVAVVIPAYRVRNHVLGVIARIGPEVRSIFVVDDQCPEQSGDLVEAECTDPRVTVVRREQNGGVGAAVKTGYRAALAAGADVVVKVDGDGQMDPTEIPRLVRPILAGRADYTKGNRFFNPEDLRRMPRTRLIGNALLSFASKASSGYYQVFDPTNGYTAIGAAALRLLPLDKIADRYFFESDLLFRLGTIRAVVQDIPMTARYEDEVSSLRIRRILGPFAWGHLKGFVKRVIYSYYVRSFSVASIELFLALPLIVFGIVYGATAWINGSAPGVPATSGQVMIAALPLIVGVQLLLAFLQYDVASTPTQPLSDLLADDQPARS